MNKESCNSCPYKIKNKHNDKWTSYVDKMNSVGLIPDKRHVCHMRGNVWSEVTEENICVGSIQRNNIYNKKINQMTRDIRRRIMSVEDVSGIGYINEKIVKIYTNKPLSQDSRDRISHILDNDAFIIEISDTNYNIE